MTEEEWLNEKIYQLRKQHETECKPYYERLAQLRARRQLVPILVAVANISGEMRDLIERKSHGN